MKKSKISTMKKIMIFTLVFSVMAAAGCSKTGNISSSGSDKGESMSNTSSESSSVGSSTDSNNDISENSTDSSKSADETSSSIMSSNSISGSSIFSAGSTASGSSNFNSSTFLSSNFNSSTLNSSISSSSSSASSSIRPPNVPVPLPMAEFETVMGINPVVTYVPQYDYSATVKAVFYTGMDYKGNKTRVFAYIGVPANASKTNKVPGVVCIHGGGGIAYGAWVQKWLDNGYAAIAMDHFGEIPSVTNQKGDVTFMLDSQGASPYTPSKPTVYPFDTINGPINQQWAYYAVSDAILANNILRADERIRTDKIGLTGVSWGGLFAGIAAGADYRFAFVIPVYGCGFLKESLTYFKYYYADPKVPEYWDVSKYLPFVTMPVLWINSDSDGAFSLNSFSKTAENTVGGDIVIKHLLPHGPNEGWSQNETYRFADRICKNGTGLADIKTQPDKSMGRNLSFDVEIPAGSQIKNVIAYYITEPLKYSAQSVNQNNWLTVTGSYTQGKAKVTLPAGVDSYYVNIEITANSKTYISSTYYIK